MTAMNRVVLAVCMLAIVVGAVGMCLQFTTGVVGSRRPRGASEAFRPTAATTKAAPVRLEFVGQAPFHIDAGEEREVIVRVINDLDDALEVTDIKGSCGCTNVGRRQFTVPAGGETEVPLVVKTRMDESGPRAIAIVAVSNNRQYSFLRNTLNIWIVRGLTYSPPMIYADNLGPSDSIERVIDFIADDETLRLRSAIASTRGVRPAIAGSRRLVVTIQGQELPPDLDVVEGVLTVDTNYPKTPQVRIRYILCKAVPFDILPKTLMADPADGDAEYNIMVRPSGSRSGIIDIHPLLGGNLVWTSRRHNGGWMLHGEGEFGSGKCASLEGELSLTFMVEYAEGSSATLRVPVVAASGRSGK